MKRVTKKKRSNRRKSRSKVKRKDISLRKQRYIQHVVIGVRPGMEQATSGESELNDYQFEDSSGVWH